MKRFSYSDMPTSRWTISVSLRNFLTKKRLPKRRLSISLISELGAVLSPRLPLLVVAAANVNPDDQRDVRQIELAYLDEVLKGIRAWQPHYTPLAGKVYSQAAQPTSSPPEAESPTFFDLDRLIDEMFNEPEIQDEMEDALQTIKKDGQPVVILGDSGCGKTALLCRLATDLAESAKKSVEQPLPVLIRFGKLENGQSLEAHIKQQLNALAPWYDSLRQTGRLAFLLDGINEIPASQHESLLDEIRWLVNAAVSSQHLLAITCRAADYTYDFDVGISRRLFIKPLDPIRIRQFIEIYVGNSNETREEIFWTLAGSEAQRFWSRFEREVGVFPEIFWRDEQLPPDTTWGFGDQETQFFYWKQWLELRNRPNTLLRLGRNPYMLRLILRVLDRQKRVPDNRAQLFQLFVEYVLMRREKLLGIDAQGLIYRVSALAFAMLHSDTTVTTTMPIALHYLGDAASLRLLQGANILEVEGTVCFTHPLLQQYFAALRLDSEIAAGAKAVDYWSADSWWEPNIWDEVAILAAGLHSNDISPVVIWVLDAAPEVAARCMVNSGGRTPEAIRYSLAQKCVSRLDETPIAARAAIGRALGLIERDPRVGVGVALSGLPDLDWVEIPAGSFIYGAGETRQTDAFAISRYPITYRQFQTFIDAEDGFQQDHWWDGLGRRETTPGTASFPYGNHPRERVNWYDAIAFCRWLSARLGYEVTLPTEYEWEHAARGVDGLMYPYGNTFDAQRGNVDTTGISKTCAVGLFPNGASPYGVLDMSGNVYEWCLKVLPI